jgi:hypothetical protein
VEVLMDPELESQGIGSLPQQAPAKLPRIPSREVYGATLDAVGQIAPEAVNEYRGAMRTAMSDVEISPQMVDILIAMFEYLVEHKDEYQQIVATLVENGIVPPSMLPDQFDQTYIGTRLAALHELKQDTAERSMPMEGMPMAQGGLADVTKYLQSQGRGGDTILAHINPEEAELLKAFGGSGAINPNTGLPEFKTIFERAFDANTYSGGARKISNALADIDDGLHKVVASPIGRLVATIGLTMIGVPPWLASAGLTAYSGGSLKDVLISGAMGYLGSGGTVMGVSPLGEIAKFMPGSAGSLLNSSLASGTLGMGAGLLQGQSLGEALKSGAMAGAQTAGLQGLGLAAPNPNAAPSDYQTLESLISAKGYDAGGNNAPQYVNGELVPGGGFPSGPNPNVPQFMQGQQTSGPISEIGGIPPAGQLGIGKDPSITPARAIELQQQYGLSPLTAEQYGAPPNPNAAPRVWKTPIPTTPGASDAAPAAQAPSTTPSGNFYLGANEGLNPAGARVSAPGDSSIISRAADFYKTPSFESFGKIFSDPNATTMIGKYGPGAAAVLGATALAGGFKSEPAKTNPAFNSSYTGLDYKRDNPQLFGGDLRAGQFSSRTPIGVPTGNMYFGGIPVPQINAPMLPTYNSGPVLGRARGGNVDFPRKIGQIDGPGTATSDSIPAMLSDGEFVFTAKAVRNAGGGSRRKGAAKMYKLMKSLENGPLGSK